MKKGKMLLVIVAILLGLVIVGCEVKEEPITTPGPDAGNPSQSTYQPVDYTDGYQFPGDWSKVPVAEFTAFFPGQASWQWLTSSAHPGAGGMNAGMGCLTCHAGQEEKLGKSLVVSATLEDDPIAGKEPIKNFSVQAAYDSENVYMKIEWEAVKPGITHTLWRYNGQEWEKFGGPRPDVDKKGTMPSYENRVTMILADKNIPAYDGAQLGFNEVGCFQTCHNSMRAMPLEPTAADIKADPFWGDAGQKKSDIRKYLLITRTELDETGGWNKVKPKSELDKLFAEGMFLDLWQFRGARSGPLQLAGDDFVFEYRNFDQGKQPFFTPGKVEWMYDESVVGFSAIPEENFNEMLDKFPLIQGVTAIPYDPAVGFKEGDIIPQPVLRPAEGSSGDVEAFSSWKDGKWTVVFKRPLKTEKADDKALAEGNIYTVAFGIFDDNVSNRRHYVTFQKSLGIGVEADIKAVKID